MVDLTVSKNSASGPAKLQEGENDLHPYDSSLDGRLAFYVNGNVRQNWRVTASADTREGPVKDLFSNFLGKSPDSLFRRIDPDYYYPSFGDDGVVQEMAPTLGKFYAKQATARIMECGAISRSAIWITTGPRRPRLVRS